MSRNFFTMDDFDFAGKTVIVRVDINSPIEPSSGKILAYTRINQTAPTINELRKSKVIILAHQSRPGKKDFTTLERHALAFSRVLGRKVRYVDCLYGSGSRKAIKNMKNGDIVLLENTRMYSEEVSLKDKDMETQANTHIVRRLAPLADFYINDAFAAAHRSQPSLVGFSEKLPSIAGRLMERELEMLGKVVEGTDRPNYLILGGAKVDDSIGVAENLLNAGSVDKIYVTAVVANIFLMAQGIDLGKGSTEFIEREVKDHAELVKKAKELLDRYGDRIVVPYDVALNVDGRREDIPVEKLPRDEPIMDIGIESTLGFAEDMRDAGCILLNGPSGVFEDEEFAFGTMELFSAVANSPAYSVLGGGHTGAAIEMMGLSRKIDHVSTGGGAFINFLMGKKMPVVEALERSYELFNKGPFLKGKGHQ